MKINEIMTKDVIAVNEEDTVLEVAKKIQHHYITYLLVN